MYFENSDQCELSVRYHLTQVQKDAWDKVLSELDALCKEGDMEERRNLENVLIEVISEVIWYNADEEPTGSEYRPYGRQDPDSWQWAREDAMLDAMGGVA